jgi:hypothetical protein
MSKKDIATLVLFLGAFLLVGSKCDELTDFWVKSEQSVRRVNNRTDVPGKTASHLVFFS